MLTYQTVECKWLYFKCIYFSIFYIRLFEGCVLYGIIFLYSPFF